MSKAQSPYNRFNFQTHWECCTFHCFFEFYSLHTLILNTIVNILYRKCKFSDRFVFPIPLKALSSVSNKLELNVNLIEKILVQMCWHSLALISFNVHCQKPTRKFRTSERQSEIWTLSCFAASHCDTGEVSHPSWFFTFFRQKPSLWDKLHLFVCLFLQVMLPFFA